ncbi:protein COFACTOR ASSEMBLY OF COMPLEX C SUBUNIT B CCB4, chloroplastic isoform X2 [Jatropha curcas]|uniref:protein COFACTOR ASSEMBLY OF COMPLEX C SUBUNIT B CCB4, chloroplastic isoform X2 n=1 Tax=Jatropha curcas TaxID=180498 RepID=UPI0009D6FCFD|nr:protein COFACTOR ASSEMBLY OF COMPLEX C SUBUNIT B CCB4, chloroplastic isoform X2 [Jatropha curcas]
MEAGTIIHNAIPWKPKRQTRRSVSAHLLNFRCFVRASSNSQGGYRGPKPRRDWVADFVSNNDDTVRSLPIYVGGVSLLAVLLNRTAANIAPVADASRSHMAHYQAKVHICDPQGVECRIIYSHLHDFVVSELLWVWESLSAVTCCRSLVIVYDSICLLQIGVAAESHNKGEALAVDAAKLMQGSLYQAVMKSGAQNYLANLSLYPGRSELPFFPSNTQAVILQPLGAKGIAIIGGHTIRGFTSSDQAWITFIGDKLDSTLGKYAINRPLAVQDRV